MHACTHTHTHDYTHTYIVKTSIFPVCPWLDYIIMFFHLFLITFLSLNRRNYVSFFFLKAIEESFLFSTFSSFLLLSLLSIGWLILQLTRIHSRNEHFKARSVCIYDLRKKVYLGSSVRFLFQLVLRNVSISTYILGKSFVTATISL